MSQESTWLRKNKKKTGGKTKNQKPNQTINQSNAERKQKTKKEKWICRQRIKRRKVTAQKVGTAAARVSAKSCNTRIKMNRIIKRIDIDHYRPHRLAPEPCNGDTMLSGKCKSKNLIVIIAAVVVVVIVADTLLFKTIIIIAIKCNKPRTSFQLMFFFSSFLLFKHDNATLQMGRSFTSSRQFSHFQFFTTTRQTIGRRWHYVTSIFNSVRSSVFVMVHDGTKVQTEIDTRMQQTRRERM